jgi:hypothetical protein
VIDYHPRRENVVANALSRKNKADDTPDDCDERELLELRRIDTKIETGPRKSFC